MVYYNKHKECEVNKSWLFSHTLRQSMLVWFTYEVHTGNTGSSILVRNLLKT